MRLSLLAFALLAVTSASAQGTGTVAGQVIENDGVTAVIGANVRVEGTALGAATDIDGNYRIIGVPVGSYTVTASYAGYTSQTIVGAEINAGSTRMLNFALGVSSYADDGCCCYETPIITNDAIGQSRVLTGQDLENMPLIR